jgi:hypothetical protein
MEDFKIVRRKLRVQKGGVFLKPRLVLSGDWLTRAGFKEGTEVIVFGHRAGSLRIFVR